MLKQTFICKHFMNYFYIFIHTNPPKIWDRKSKRLWIVWIEELYLRWMRTFILTVSEHKSKTGARESRCPGSNALFAFSEDKWQSHNLTNSHNKMLEVFLLASMLKAVNNTHLGNNNQTMAEISVWRGSRYGSKLRRKVNYRTKLLSTFEMTKPTVPSRSLV